MMDFPYPQQDLDAPSARADRDAGTDRVILLPLPDPRAAAVLLPVARTLAQSLGGQVHLLCASPEPDAAGALLQHAGLGAAALRDMVLETKPSLTPAAIIQEARARRPWLIVAASRTPDTPAGQALDPAALELLRQAPCPVLLVPPDGTVAFQTPAACHILLPVDGTPVTAAAIGPVIELAHACGGVIDVLHVAATGRARSAASGSMSAPRYVDQPQHEWPAWIQEFLQRMCCFGQCATARAQLILATGKPADVILQTASARGCTLIALIWRGRLSATHGRIVQAILDATHCPVLLVRTQHGRQGAAA